MAQTKIHIGQLNTVGLTSGGSGGSLSQAVVTVPTVAYGEYEAVVTDATVSATDKITCAFNYGGTDDENGLEELDDMKVFGVAGSGQVTFTLTHQRGAFAGVFKINYSRSA